MQSYWMETISKTGIFIICAQVLIHFRPKASYDKYLKMLVCAMILIQIFIPVSGLFTGEGEETLKERVAWFETELQRCMDEVMQGYDMEPVEPEAGMNSDGDGELSVAPLSPITNIHISIGKGDETDADISTGQQR